MVFLLQRDVRLLECSIGESFRSPSLSSFGLAKTGQCLNTVVGAAHSRFSFGVRFSHHSCTRGRFSGFMISSSFETIALVQHLLVRGAVHAETVLCHQPL